VTSLRTEHRMNSIFPTAASLTAQRSLWLVSRAMNSSLERLATGYRINRGADDPAGLITSENLRASLAALEAESRTLQRANAVVTTADAALAEVSNLLIEAESLAIANANTGGLSDAERLANQMQIDSILSSVNRIAGSTTFAGQPLLDGSATVTAGGGSVTIDSVSTGNLGEVEIDGDTYSLADVATGGALNTVDGDISGAQQAIRAASSQVATQRGELGAFSLYTIGARASSIAAGIENIAAAESVIRNTDYAVETANLARLRVLYDASAMAVMLTSRGSLSILSLLA